MLLILILLLGALTNKPFAFQNRPQEIEKINYFDFFSSELTNLKIQYNFDFSLKKIPIIRTFAIPKNQLSNKIRFILNSVLTQKVIFPYFNLKQISQFKSFKLLKKKLFNLNIPTFLIDKTFANFQTILKIKNLTNFNLINLKFLNLNLINSNYFNYFNLNNLTNFTTLQLFIFLNLNLRFETPIFFFKIRKFNLNKNLLKLILINSTFNKIYLQTFSKNTFNFLKKIFFSQIKFKFIPILNYFFFFNNLKLNLTNYLNLFNFKNLKKKTNNFYTLFNTVSENLISFLNLIEINFFKLKNYLFLNYENDNLNFIQKNNFKFKILFITSAILKKINNYNLILPTLNLFYKTSYYFKNNYFIKLIRLLNITKNLNFLINLNSFFNNLKKKKKKKKNYLNLKKKKRKKKRKRKKKYFFFY